MSLLFLWNANLKVIIAYCFFWLIFPPILFFSYSQTSLPAYTFPSPALICSPWDLQFSCVRGRVGGGRYISPCSLFNKDYSYRLRAGMFMKAERFYSSEKKTLLAEINSNWLSCIIIASREGEICWKKEEANVRILLFWWVCMFETKYPCHILTVYQCFWVYRALCSILFQSAFNMPLAAGGMAWWTIS